MPVCEFVSVFVCPCLLACACMHLCVGRCMHAFVCVCLCVCAYVCVCDSLLSPPAVAGGGAVPCVYVD
jgi:hypothetical protein